jgi:hypothetical protein
VVGQQRANGRWGEEVTEKANEGGETFHKSDKFSEPTVLFILRTCSWRRDGISRHSINVREDRKSWRAASNVFGFDIELSTGQTELYLYLKSNSFQPILIDVTHVKLAYQCGEDLSQKKKHKRLPTSVIGLIFSLDLDPACCRFVAVLTIASQIVLSNLASPLKRLAKERLCRFTTINDFATRCYFPQLATMCS